MTLRDRIVLMVIAVLVVIAAGWMLVVSPERKKASTIQAEVSSAQATLATAESQLANVRTAQSQYASAYASVVSLGKAVPPSQEIPSLIVELAQASGQKHVEFASIATGGGSGGSTSTSKTASAGAAPAAAASFTQMPFTFVFNGSFFNLESLFHRIDSFASAGPSGTVEVSGRLLTVQSVKLAPTTQSNGKSQLTGTITATAYELPAGQGLTGSATAAGATAQPTATGTAAASSPTAPAVARVTP